MKKVSLLLLLLLPRFLLANQLGIRIHEFFPYNVLFQDAKHLGQMRVQVGRFLATRRLSGCLIVLLLWLISSSSKEFVADPFRALGANVLGKDVILAKDGQFGRRTGVILLGNRYKRCGGTKQGEQDEESHDDERWAYGWINFGLGNKISVCLEVCSCGRL